MLGCRNGRHRTARAQEGAHPPAHRRYGGPPVRRTRLQRQRVTYREENTQDPLCDRSPSRPPAVTPAAAIRGFVLEAVAGIRSIPPEIWRGELGYLAAISPTIHRLVLEL